MNELGYKIVLWQIVSRKFLSFEKDKIKQKISLNINNIDCTFICSILLYVAPQLTQGNFQVSNIVHSEIFGIYLVSKFKNTS